MDSSRESRENIYEGQNLNIAIFSVICDTFRYE